MQNTLEEREVPEQGSGQEPEPETREPTPPPEDEAAEQETTALVPTEPDVIEGEVIELAPPEETTGHTPPKQKPYWLLIPFTIFLCLAFLAGSFLVPLFTPTATITVIPVERTLTATTTIQVQGRQVAPLTLSQSMTVAATGMRHQDATRAKGTITFYNGLLSPQTIAGGTVLTGSDGVLIVTDQPARIPAANPPVEGQITVPAHALSAGPQGNISAYDINQACCATSILAKNTQAFTGGAAARDSVVVTHGDIARPEAAMKTTLERSESAALQAQAPPGESLTPPLCSENVVSDHRPGDEAESITVTVSETCRSIAYASRDVYQDATQLLTSQAGSTLGANYTPLGDMHVSLIHATITDTGQGKARITVQITGTWVYRITRAMQQQLTRLIAGKTNQQAAALLFQFPGLAHDMRNEFTEMFQPVLKVAR